MRLRNGKVIENPCHLQKLKALLQKFDRVKQEAYRKSKIKVAHVIYDVYAYVLYIVTHENPQFLKNGQLRETILHNMGTLIQEMQVDVEQGKDQATIDYMHHRILPIFGKLLVHVAH